MCLISLPISLQFGLLNIQIKDLQKQVTTIQAEKAATLRERDEFKTEVAKLQTKLQASAMQVSLIKLSFNAIYDLDLLYWFVDYIMVLCCNRLRSSIKTAPHPREKPGRRP